jgi:inorganic triphosphatase YgiF
VGTEVELKLATSKTGLRNALGLPWLRRMAGADPKKHHLVSLYFDTRDLALRDHDVSLRVRRVGRERLQTIKAKSAVPMARGEWEARIDGDWPKLELTQHTALSPILTDDIAQHLKPVFETRVKRTVLPLHVGRSQIELAIDDARIASVSSSVDIAEIEIELKQGEPGDVARLARKLAHELPVTLGVRAKADWGYALLEGTINAPMPAEAVALAPSAAVADAFAAIGFSCLRQIAGNEFSVRQGDPEGIHQMRVGLRRLRAALSLFKDMLQGRKTDHLKSELIWLTEQLGPARDTDVFISKTVAPYLEHHPQRREFEMLAHDLERERNAEFARAKEAVESARFRRLLLDCALWLIDGGWRNDDDDLKRALRERAAGAFAREELAPRTRKIVKRVRKLERLDAASRHKLRIAVKKVRYAREFFATLHPDGLHRNGRRKIDRALKDLKNSLGGLNDMRVHVQLARRFAAAGAASQKAFALGYLTGREAAHQKDLLREAASAGKLLKKAA